MQFPVADDESSRCPRRPASGLESTLLTPHAAFQSVDPALRKNLGIIPRCGSHRNHDYAAAGGAGVRRRRCGAGA